MTILIREDFHENNTVKTPRGCTFAEKSAVSPHHYSYLNLSHTTHKSKHYYCFDVGNHSGRSTVSKGTELDPPKDTDVTTFTFTMKLRRKICGHN